MDTPIPLAFQNLLDTIPDGTPGKTSFEIIAKQFGVVERELAAEKARGDRLEKALEKSRQWISKLEKSVTRGHSESCVCGYCEEIRHRKSKGFTTIELVRAALGDSNG